MFRKDSPSKFRYGLDNIIIHALFFRLPDTTPEGTSGSILLRCILDGKHLKFYCSIDVVRSFYISQNWHIQLLSRSTHEVVDIDGAIYSLGGNDGSASLNSMERYAMQCTLLHKVFLPFYMN